MYVGPLLNCSLYPCCIELFYRKMSAAIERIIELMHVTVPLHVFCLTHSRYMCMYFVSCTCTCTNVYFKMATLYSKAGSGSIHVRNCMLSCIVYDWSSSVIVSNSSALSSMKTVNLTNTFIMCAFPTAKIIFIKEFVVSATSNTISV